jgi:hypothetical protein
MGNQGALENGVNIIFWIEKLASNIFYLRKPKVHIYGFLGEENQIKFNLFRLSIIFSITDSKSNACLFV